MVFAVIPTGVVRLTCCQPLAVSPAKVAVAREVPGLETFGYLIVTAESGAEAHRGNHPRTVPAPRLLPNREAWSHCCSSTQCDLACLGPELHPLPDPAGLFENFFGGQLLLRYVLVHDD